MHDTSLAQDVPTKHTWHKKAACSCRSMNRPGCCFCAAASCHSQHTQHSDANQQKKEVYTLEFMSLTVPCMQVPHAAPCCAPYKPQLSPCIGSLSLGDASSLSVTARLLKIGTALCGLGILSCHCRFLRSKLLHLGRLAPACLTF